MRSVVNNYNYNKSQLKLFCRCQNLNSSQKSGIQDIFRNLGVPISTFCDPSPPPSPTPSLHQSSQPLLDDHSDPLPHSPTDSDSFLITPGSPGFYRRSGLNVLLPDHLRDLSEDDEDLPDPEAMEVDQELQDVLEMGPSWDDHTVQVLKLRNQVLAFIVFSVRCVASRSTEKTCLNIGSYIRPQGMFFSVARRDVCTRPLAARELIPWLSTRLPTPVQCESFPFCNIQYW